MQVACQGTPSGPRAPGEQRPAEGLHVTASPDSLRLLGRSARPDADGELDAAHLNHAPVRDLDHTANRRPVYRRPVLAPEVLEPHDVAAAFDVDSRVAPRHARRIQPHGAARIAA